MQALTLGCYRLWCWRINSLLQRSYEHHSLRFQLNCVLFFRELIESLSPLWGFIMRHEQGFVGWFLWQTPSWNVSLCHDCMRWGLLSGGGCSYLDSINQDLASWLLSIQIPDQSNGQIIIAKKYKMNFPSDIISHQHYIQIYSLKAYRIKRQNNIWQLFFI